MNRQKHNDTCKQTAQGVVSCHGVKFATVLFGVPFNQPIGLCTAGHMMAWQAMNHWRSERPELWMLSVCLSMHDNLCIIPDTPFATCFLGPDWLRSARVGDKYHNAYQQNMYHSTALVCLVVVWFCGRFLLTSSSCFF